MAKKWLHVFKHTTDEWSDFYGGGGGLPRTSDFVNIDEDKFSQWIVDVTNEKLLSTEYGDGWTLDEYEVVEHTDGHWKGMWEIQVKRITHPDSGSLGI